MKKLLVIIALSSIYFIFGCTETGQVAGPENETITFNESDGIPLSQLNIIELPVRSKKSLNKVLEDKEFIKINSGGDLEVYDWYEGGPHKWVEVWAKLKIKRKSINEETSFYEDANYTFSEDGKKLLFSLAVDDNELSGTFYPHIMFDEPVKFDLEFRGLDLTGTDPDNVQFAYVPEGSEQAYIPKVRKIHVDVKKGTLRIQGAELQHFSRYIVIR